MEVRIWGTWIYLETAGGEGGQWASVILTHLRYWDCELSQIAHQDFARKQAEFCQKLKSCVRIFTNILLVFGPRIKNLGENLLEDKKNYLLAPYTDLRFSIGG